MRLPTYSEAVATIALFIALGGSVYAASNKIDQGTIAANIHTVQYVNVTISLPDSEETSVPGGTTGTGTCPSGMKVIGGGAILTETVYNLHGIGQQAATAIGNFDTVTLLVIVMITALAVVIMGAVIDILYAVLDPRIRL